MVEGDLQLKISSRKVASVNLVTVVVKGENPAPWLVVMKGDLVLYRVLLKISCRCQQWSDNLFNTLPCCRYPLMTVIVLFIALYILS